MLAIECPECGVSGSVSLAQPVFEGPYRCWKCRRLFTVRIEGNELKSCTPLSQKDFDKWQEEQDAQGEQNA